MCILFFACSTLARDQFAALLAVSVHVHIYIKLERAHIFKRSILSKWNEKEHDAVGRGRTTRRKKHRQATDIFASRMCSSRCIKKNFLFIFAKYGILSRKMAKQWKRSTLIMLGERARCRDWITCIHKNEAYCLLFTCISNGYCSAFVVVFAFEQTFARTIACEDIIWNSIRFNKNKKKTQQQRQRTYMREEEEKLYTKMCNGSTFYSIYLAHKCVH